MREVGEVDGSRWREVVVRVQNEQGEAPISVFAFASKSLVVLGSYVGNSKPVSQDRGLEMVSGFHSEDLQYNILIPIPPKTTFGLAKRCTPPEGLHVSRELLGD